MSSLALKITLFCFELFHNWLLGRIDTPHPATPWSHILLLLFSHVQLFVTTWTAVQQASLSINNSRSLLKIMSIKSVMPSNHLILCPPLLLPPSIFPSIRVFSKWVSASHQVAKGLEFQLQHRSFQWTLRTDLLWDGLVGFPYTPRDFQKSPPTPQLKSINSSALSIIYSPTLTFIPD